MKRDEDVRRLFESATVGSRPEERAAVREAAAPVLRELEAAAGIGSAGAESAAVRPAAPDRGPALVAALRSFLRPGRLGFSAALAVVLAVLLWGRPPATRESRSAPLQSWAEHVTGPTGQPFPLAAAPFGRPY